MTMMDTFALFDPVDYAALAALVVGWWVIGWIIEHGIGQRCSVSMLMVQYREEWMTHMITREPRVFDAQILGSLRQGTAFFASATMIAIGGCLALLGNAEQLVNIAEDLTLGQDPVIVWEIKVLVILGFLANAFFKFVWANRLFGYCGVVMGAVPNDPNHADVALRTSQAAEISNFSARSFNRGLRAIYFSLAATAWLLGPWALMAAAATTCLMLVRREFMSQSHATLSRGALSQTPTQS
ncbi:MAG: DUF599 domain-containing protein [Roseovarius sp.]